MSSQPFIPPHAFGTTLTQPETKTGFVNMNLTQYFSLGGKIEKLDYSNISFRPKGSNSTNHSEVVGIKKVGNTNEYEMELESEHVYKKYADEITVRVKVALA